MSNNGEKMEKAREGSKTPDTMHVKKEENWICIFAFVLHEGDYDKYGNIENYYQLSSLIFASIPKICYYNQSNISYI